MAGNQIYNNDLTLVSFGSAILFILLDVKSGGAAINFPCYFFFLLSFFSKSLFSGGVSYQNVHLYILSFVKI